MNPHFVRYRNNNEGNQAVGGGARLTTKLCEFLQPLK